MGRDTRTGSGEPRPSLLLPLLVFVLALGLLLFSGDLGELSRSLGAFQIGYFPAVLALSLLNYALRFVRWDIYLRVIGARVSPLTSGTIFASGLAMSVTPGKAGELVKAYAMHKVAGTPVRRVVPVVLMERVSDVAGVLVLVALGSLEGTHLPLVIIGTALVVFHGLLLWPVPARWFLHVSLRHPRLTGIRDRCADAFESLVALARPAPLAFASLLSVLGWAAEGVGLWLVIEGLGGGVSLSAAVMAYALATLLGAVSFVPGGLIVTEGSMTAILVAMGLSRTHAALATTLVRIATLWFAVGVGCAAFLWAWPRIQRRHESPAET